MHHIRYDVQIPEQTQDINNTLIGGRVKCSASINDGRRPLNVYPPLSPPQPLLITCARPLLLSPSVWQLRCCLSPQDDNESPRGSKVPARARIVLFLPSIFVSLSLSLCTLLYFKPTFSLSLAVHLTTPPA